MLVCQMVPGKLIIQAQPYLRMSRREAFYTLTILPVITFIPLLLVLLLNVQRRGLQERLPLAGRLTPPLVQNFYMLNPWSSGTKKEKTTLLKSLSVYITGTEDKIQKFQMENKTKRTNKKGYTLIEILVGITIFMVILAASTDFFVSSLEMQQKALISQRLLDNVSYSLEYMSRALRMAQKDSGGDCITVNSNYEPTRGGNGIKFLNYQGKCQEFYWDTTGYPTNPVRSLKVQTGSDPVIDLTPGFLDVVSFKIGPSDSWDQNDEEQPRVTIFLETKGVKYQKPELQPTIKIQTTISQRNLDIQM